MVYYLDSDSDNSIPVGVKLNKPSDWAMWYRSLKEVAEFHSVWEYVDPDQQRRFRRLQLPETPRKFIELFELVNTSSRSPSAVPQRKTEQADMSMQTHSAAQSGIHHGADRISFDMPEEQPEGDATEPSITPRKKLSPFSEEDATMLVLYFNQNMREAKGLATVFLYILASIDPTYKACIFDEKDARSCLQKLIKIAKPSGFENERPLNLFEEIPTRSIIFSTGSDVHTFNSLEWFIDINRTLKKPFRARLMSCVSEGQGTVAFKAANGKEIIIDNVLYFSDYPMNIASAAVLEDKGYCWHSVKHETSVYDTGELTCRTKRLWKIRYHSLHCTRRTACQTSRPFPWTLSEERPS